MEKGKRALRLPILSLLLLALLAQPALGSLKNSMDLGNIVIGDELYIDAETFFNQDFSSNPGFFAFPTSVKKSSFEMYSMPNSEY